MHIVVHDFAGHPFQVQLSRELAANGHRVAHVYLKDLPGPKGPLQQAPGDAPSFRAVPLTLGAPLDKYSMWKRHFAHRRYARRLTAFIDRERPDVLLSANTPIDVQDYVRKECRRRNIAFVHWMQDLYCMAVRSVLTKKLGSWGAPLAWHYDRLERRVCESSDAVVFITPDFLTAASRMGFHPARNYVVENWAPLDDIHPVAKRNSWSKRHGLADKLVFLYSGTLGLKHKPELLYQMAAALEDRNDVLVVVVSEGLGRSWLERKLREAPLKNLLLMDFQPYAAMPEVLGAADVLLAVIEKDAGVFAVPSKVLSYFCAGRPVLLAAPDANLAARTVERAQAGIAVDPDDAGSLIDAARRLAASPEMRRALADNARRYAATTFDIKSITGKFDAILRGAVEGLALPEQTFDPVYSRAATD